VYPLRGLPARVALAFQASVTLPAETEVDGVAPAATASAAAVADPLFETAVQKAEAPGPAHESRETPATITAARLRMRERAPRVLRRLIVGPPR
jgi:hypothetical protein